MVYVDTWDEFAEKAEVLFRADPSKFRYVSKYRHCDGKLVLKATDDRVCIKFRTDQAQDAKKMERLNNLLFTLMARGPDAVVESLSLEPQQLAAQQQQQQQQQARRGRGRRQ